MTSKKTRTPRTDANLPADEFSVDNAPNLEEPTNENAHTPEAPVDAPATVSAAPCYMLTDKALAIREKATLQRSAPKQGMQWRATGKIDSSIRHAAIEALLEIAQKNEAGQLLVTYNAAHSAFVALAESGRLGCSTPASRISKLVRSGHLALVA